MKILAIESSCDETAAAVVEDGRTVLSNIVASQVEEHKLYGGVVPEIASRRHAEAIVRSTSYTAALSPRSRPDDMPRRSSAWWMKRSKQRIARSRRSTRSPSLTRPD